MHTNIRKIDNKINTENLTRYYTFRLLQNLQKKLFTVELYRNINQSEGSLQKLSHADIKWRATCSHFRHVSRVKSLLKLLSSGRPRRRGSLLLSGHQRRRRRVLYTPHRLIEVARSCSSHQRSFSSTPCTTTHARRARTCHLRTRVARRRTPQHATVRSSDQRRPRHPAGQPASPPDRASYFFPEQPADCGLPRTDAMNPVRPVNRSSWACSYLERRAPTDHATRVSYRPATAAAIVGRSKGRCSSATRGRMG